MTWNDTRKEIEARSSEGGQSSADLVRRERITTAQQISGVPLIVYASDFTDEIRAAQFGAGLQIELSDKSGFLQALSDIENGPLDVLIHSPGGSPAATESIVTLLRSRFNPIRFIVPLAAKSAATMLALSGNEILMGEAAELGPIDPQLRISHDQRVITVPAGAAIAQFRAIHQEVTKNPDKLRGWLPILRQYGPSFLQECINSIDLSQKLVADWLETYMFEGKSDAKQRSEGVASWLANHGNFNSHSRPVFLHQLKEKEPGLKIRYLREESSQFEAAIMGVYWAIDVTFSTTAAFKIIEHCSEEAAFIRLGGVSPVIRKPEEDIASQQLNRQQRRQKAKGKRSR